MRNFGFVMEQTLGHVTHHQNLARWVADTADICPHWMPIVPDKADRWARIPGIRSNWSLLASLRARDALYATLRQTKLQALFLHTQTTALFSVSLMRRIPSVVSLDATPLNYDSVGAEYGHIAGDNSWLERRKYAWNRATFHAATALVTWCDWAKDSLVKDYGVTADRIVVIPPGIDMERWSFGAERTERRPGPIRLLFVGGDFARKGGPTLVEAYRNGLYRSCELDIVTKDEAVERDLKGAAGIRVHRGLTANSTPLRDLYANADLFVFPTRGDCLPIAVMEAMAAGLPVIATDIGALREEVEEGINGLMVPPGDAGAVTAAVQRLCADPALRHTMSVAGRQMAEKRFDAARNYNAILDLLRRIGDGTPTAGRLA
jgi:glycosyltransferase involved in cell wall biosynthesis